MDNSSAAGVDMRGVCVELEEVLPKDRAVVVDGGYFFTAPAQYISAQDLGSFHLAFNFGSIGLGCQSPSVRRMGRESQPPYSW